MNKTAFIFPGQGSQAVGMGKDFFDSFSAARQVFEEADDALGFSLSKMCFEGNSEDLQLTANTQPAILTASIAILRAMETEGIRKPEFVAGHSLGEYSALVAAGSLAFSDAVRIVRKRGEFMQEAVPVGVGAMAAILGLDLNSLEDVCNEASQGMICSAANINSPSQIVIAGDAEAVDRACEIAKARGAKRAIRLNVSAPFHCALMMPAQDRLEKLLEEFSFADLEVPIVENVSAETNSSGARAREALVNQVSNPVRWVESVEMMITSGVNTFVEIGPGKVLSGLVRQINREVKTFNFEVADGLREAVKSF